MFVLKRVYDVPDKGDGLRILVERLWPRGITKQRAALDKWEKELAPSPALRQWYRHDLARWKDFSRRYEAEITAKKELLDWYLALGRDQTVTLVYAAKDVQHSSTFALQKILEKQAKSYKAVTGGLRTHRKT